MSAFFKRMMGLAALAVGALGALPAHAGPYTSLYVFGDSLSDTGTLQALTGGQFPNPADGPYAGGRYSDGLLWVERLASKLGVANDAKSFTAGGKNYAVAGARTGAGGNPPGVLAQLGGLWNPAAPVDPNALYVVVGGGNDMRDGRSAFQTNSVADQAGRQGAALAAANNLILGLGFLASRGAHNVLISNLPNLGGTPEAFLLGLVAPSTDISNRFNALMPFIEAAGEGFGLDIDVLDMAAVGQKVIADATTNGGAVYGITNVTAPCTGFALSAALGGTSCAVSLFADVLHPSAAAHAIIAQAAFDLVPEPAGLLLVATAMGALVITRRRA